MIVKENNFVVIHSFMIKDLHLRGNELMIYAIIYGFSQDGINKYKGSLNYLAEWLGTSKQSVVRTLKTLVEKKLIIKEDYYRNNVKFCSYYVNITNGVNEMLTGCKQNVNGGVNKMLTNNIYNNIKDNNYNNIVINNIDDNSIVDVIDYLNLKTGKKYKHTTPKTKTLIKARLKEGFTVSDFKKVIDDKVFSWGSDINMSKYLRPETLFGTKFEGYLNSIGNTTVVSKPKEEQSRFKVITNIEEYK